MTRPGGVISVYQLKPPMPGFIAHITGFLMTKIYQYATVYMDQLSILIYVYTQKTASAEDAQEVKELL